MSHLRAPAARADRREGGRHGRPVARTASTLPETHIRPQLLRLAVLPPIAVALSASAAVLFTVRTTAARPGLTLWIVLGGAVAVALVGIVIAAVAADRAARSVRDRIGTLRRTSARGQADLRALVETLRRGDGPPERSPRSQPVPDADEFDLLADDMARAHDGAVSAVVAAAQLSSHADSEQKVEVFVNLARRLQSLVHREISILDELENEIEDPDLLKGLFHVDHLATRIRRHAENLAVLGGAVSRRQWSNPVSMTEVLRSATAEVEQYSRVKLVPPIDGTVRGHAVADVIHLLAELVENATVFSAPHTQVLLRANVVTSGLAVEVEDRGLGMPLAEQHKMNALLADPDQVNVASLLQDGRIGLFVVSQLARRHGIVVRLQTNIYGGVQAVLVVPQALLGAEDEPRRAVQQAVQQAGGGGDAAVGARSVAGAGGAGIGAGAGAGRLREVSVEGAAGAGALGQGSSGLEAETHGGLAHGAHAPHAQAHGAQAHGAVAYEASAQGTSAHGTPAHGVAAHSSSTRGAAASHVMSAQEPPLRSSTPLHGVPGQDAPLHGTPPHGTPAHSSSVHGTPAQGTPAHGSPVHGSPVQASPVHGSPAYGTPGQGTSIPVQGAVPGASGDVPRAAGQEPTSYPSHDVHDAHDAQGVYGVHGARAAVPVQPRRDSAPGGASVVNGGAPAPLPVRGAEARPNPAEAVPGIRPGDRRLVAENTVTLPTPRGGAVRGTMSKPQLPKRRAQEHLVPELRDGPAPRPDSEFLVGHDPGLMAAFQRGIGLAEAQFPDAAHGDAGHGDAGHMGQAHVGPAPMDGTPIGEAHPAHPAHEPPEAHAAFKTAPVPGHDLTARHDGSTPAG
ncbi:ATP-binding protein [Streptomyces sp. NBC_00878]|uniref:ATP-binding protein n=1 Tax=Streptomyces sp. NBC_00878 TaxID=2975854 RepID=UPI00224F8726|nr:ATP-binding protein [Streptomyces sp. NBC_00878]MCX4903618.1 ATP-binding protein [Streptomyces sp. NBC_00878]